MNDETNFVKIIVPSPIEVDDYHEFDLILNQIKNISFDDSVDIQEIGYDEDLRSYIGILYNENTIKEKNDLLKVISES